MNSLSWGHCLCFRKAYKLFLNKIRSSRAQEYKALKARFLSLIEQIINEKRTWAVHSGHNSQRGGANSLIVHFLTNLGHFWGKFRRFLAFLQGYDPFLTPLWPLCSVPQRERESLSNWIWYLLCLTLMTSKAALLAIFSAIALCNTTQEILVIQPSCQILAA